MGHGIALVAAKAGYEVVLHDIKDEYVKKGLRSSWINPLRKEK